MGAKRDERRTGGVFEYAARKTRKRVPYYEFDVTRAEKPLKRKDIEREVENFVDQDNVIDSPFLLKNILMSGAVR